MSSQSVPFDWKQVDEKLVSLMMSKLAEEFGKLNQEDFHQIHYLNMGNQNAMTVPSQRFEMQLLRIGEMAARIYDMYCEVWRCQQKDLLPDFLRTVSSRGIGMLISARTGSVTFEFALEQKRTGSPNPQWLKSATESFKRNTDLLRAEWQRTAEIDAKTLEYLLAGAPNNAIARGIAIQIVHARTQLRMLDTKIASLQARITMSEQALSATQIRPPDAYRVKAIEQSHGRLIADKELCENRRDQWQVKLDASMNRSTELRAQAASESLYHNAEGPAVAPQPQSVGADLWHGLHLEFTALTEEELRRDPSNRNDKWLRCYVTRSQEEGEQLSLSAGLDEGFRARFEALATRAGIALGAQPGEASPLDFWLRALFENLLEHKSHALFAANKEGGGIITRVCEASATFCSRLEKSALNQLAQEPQATQNKPPVSGSGKVAAQIPVPQQLKYASPLKKAVGWVLTLDHHASDLAICRHFDENGSVELPKSWTSGENRSFELAYKDPQHRRKIEKLISKVRTDMRRKGLLS